MQSIPRLETERLLLRAVYPDDAGSLFEIYSDPLVTQYCELKTIGDLEAANDLISLFAHHFQNDTGVRWGIFLKETDQLIGVCCFDSYTTKFHTANIGYDILASQWGNGFASETVDCIVKQAFEHGLVSKINRIQAIVHAENSASMRVLEKTGFRQEGKLEQYGYWDGEYHDMFLYAKLKG